MSFPFNVELNLFNFFIITMYWYRNTLLFQFSSQFVSV